tara:strand:+ start:5245 stop:5499 length:255 start_codon:yes stop_codon:yes gene_type:complete
METHENSIIFRKDDDIQNICSHVINKISIKLILFLTIIYIITSSLAFEEFIKKKYNKDNLIYYKTLIFVIMFIIIDILIKLDIL